ncbi:hypothetical protein A9Y76_14035 [Ralstonia insidiosa]|uniref:HTH Mu-type domain-containing protein n=1 Tax=Ralstonia insidiosa TaxID=190721 RepID=A0A191ZZP0_9RALS|nr:hypothetical protein A9Y76_14035 [Ralstonia insidiosa]
MCLDGNTFRGLSVPPEKLYSAAEIAKMRLEGLPTTKGKVIERAASEGWQFEERKGIGGTRRMYEIPARYLPRSGGAGVADVTEAPRQPAKVVGTVVAGTSKVDPKLLQLAEEALEEWQRERGLRLDAQRRYAVVAVLYDYLARGADQADAADMLRVISGE